MNRDPIGERSGVNIYSFVANSPTNGVDKLGLFLQYVDDPNALEEAIIYGQGPYTDPIYPVGPKVHFDWQAVIEELILDQVQIRGSLSGGLSIPVGAGVVNIYVTGEVSAYQCIDSLNAKRKMFSAKSVLSVEGGIGVGLGIKKYPFPKGRDRNKRGDFGKKLKHLAGKNLPWYRQRMRERAGALEFGSSADNACMCPKKGWSGSLRVGIYGRVGAGLLGDPRTFVEWQFGTSFTWDNIDGKVKASLLVSSEVSAQLGVFGETEAAWSDYIM